jgi:hypothetical protein
VPGGSRGLKMQWQAEFCASLEIIPFHVSGYPIGVFSRVFDRVDESRIVLWCVPRLRRAAANHNADERARYHASQCMRRLLP